MLKASTSSPSTTTVRQGADQDGRLGVTIRATQGPFHGTLATAFADLAGRRGPTEAIAVNRSGILVKRGLGNGTFAATTELWTGKPYYGARGTYFADVTGDGRADAIAVNSSGTTVRPSSGSAFGPTGPRSADLSGVARGLQFDADQNGTADAIRLEDDRVLVFRSTGRGFGPAEPWTRQPFHGDVANLAVVLYDWQSGQVAAASRTWSPSADPASGWTQPSEDRPHPPEGGAEGFVGRAAGQRQVPAVEEARAA